jgi:hypothetical protein
MAATHRLNALQLRLGSFQFAVQICGIPQQPIKPCEQDLKHRSNQESRDNGFRFIAGVDWI